MQYTFTYMYTFTHLTFRVLIIRNIVTAPALAFTRMVLHSQTKQAHACTSEINGEWGDTLKQGIMLHSYASDGTVSNIDLSSVSARGNYLSMEMGVCHKTVEPG